MKRYQVTWGWKPPQYDRPKGNFRMFYHSEEVSKEMKELDRGTGEVTSRTVTRWMCDVVEYDRQEATEILRLMKENRNSPECSRWLLKARIRAYDKSRHVEDFTINGEHLWLDKDKRSGLKLRFEAELAKGKEETALWHGGRKFVLETEAAIRMMRDLEVYAAETFDVKSSHEAAADSLQTSAEMRAYDYTAGYPAKLAF